MEIPVVLTEDDGGDHTPEEWRRLGREAEANGTYVLFWRGTLSDGEWRDLLRQDR